MIGNNYEDQIMAERQTKSEKQEKQHPLAGQASTKHEEQKKKADIIAAR